MDYWARYCSSGSAGGCCRCHRVGVRGARSPVLSEGGCRGITVVARSALTGEMVGALLSEDSASEPPDGLNQVSQKFNPIFDILGQLDAEYREGRTMLPGEVMHLFLLGVSQRFAGKGVAQRLVAEALANGARKGYRLAVTEATNKTSQHLFRKQGFVDRVFRSYSNHRFEGHAFFGSIVDQGGPILMDRHLRQRRKNEKRLEHVAMLRFASGHVPKTQAARRQTDGSASTGCQVPQRILWVRSREPRKYWPGGRSSAVAVLEPEPEQFVSTLRGFRRRQSP